MIQIRQSVFETNSSSTHAISIMAYDKDKCNFVNDVCFNHTQEFGWEFEHYNDVVSKAGYLWIVICTMYSYLENEDKLIAAKDYILNTLRSVGITNVTFVQPDYKYSDWNKKYYLCIDGYIDHCDLSGMVEEMLQDPEMLLSYLFDERSTVNTGNDNSDWDVEFVDNAKWMIYKGN